MRNPWLDLPSEPPYVLPVDQESLAGLRQRIASRGRIEQRISLETLPEPFIGNPDTATVMLLSLNPGGSAEDKKTHTNPEFRETILCNLRHGKQEYPFYGLNPKFGWTGCGTWWTRHVRGLLEHSALNRQRIAQRLCVVEWFPYHSQKNGVPARSSFPSQQYSFDIVKRAIGRKLIVGMRSRNRWRDVDSRLADVPYLKNPQAPYISPGNAGERLFNNIVEALK